MHFTSVIVSGSVFCIWLTTPVVAQIPEEFENLQVLTEDIERRELLETMRGFSFSLGVRCEFCHLSRGGSSLSDIDFADDDKETKRAARHMMRMVRAINEDHLAKLGKDTPLIVECRTCHRGVSRPEPIDRIFERTLEDSGIEEALARYGELRDEHYGSASYDFGPTPLNRLGERLKRAGRLDDAVAVLELNASHHPDSLWLYRLLGDAHLETGDEEAARKAYEHVLSLDPDNAYANNQLEQLSSR